MAAPSQPPARPVLHRLLTPLSPMGSFSLPSPAMRTSSGYLGSTPAASPMASLPCSGCFTNAGCPARDPFGFLVEKRDVSVAFPATAPAVTVVHSVPMTSAPLTRHVVTSTEAQPRLTRTLTAGVAQPAQHLLLAPPSPVHSQTALVRAKSGLAALGTSPQLA
eukprot:TRINITY_DN67252_c0_g1_i1.p1 TRINITY_DN67252_c0_g1~~TRINITY_DN67252_c0_g1_i1.p1  ORF type:complete len:163 (-),score=3.06 TRINITY_DN67252_c0_g1_i1:79-567(-)